MIPKQYLDLSYRGPQTSKCPNCDWKMRKVKIIQEWGLEPSYPTASTLNESSAKAKIVTETMNSCNNSYKYSEQDRQREELNDAGLDYDELEFMYEDERREIIENEGLEPDEYDFY